VKRCAATSASDDHDLERSGSAASSALPQPVDESGKRERSPECGYLRSDGVETASVRGGRTIHFLILIVSARMFACVLI